MENIRGQALVDLLQAVRNTNYTFTTITPLSHATVNARSENLWAKNSKVVSDTNHTSEHKILRDIFGWSRPFHEIHLDPIIFQLMQKAGVLKPFEDGWISTVRISTWQHKAFATQYFMHSAYPTTDADSVFFGPDTYRYLHEINMEMSSRITVKRAIDIGAGAGPGAILLGLQYPSADVYAVDINQQALDLTTVNATVANSKNVQAVYSDLLSGVEGEFDLIIANPPYLVDVGQRAYRHGGGDLGADFSYAIVESSITRLSPGGSLLLYTGIAINDGVDTFKCRVEAYLQSLGNQYLKWSYREIDPDIFGEELANACYAETDRIAAVILKITNTTTL